MNNRAFIKFTGITVAFVILILGYVYFNEQSLLSSGKANANTVVQSIKDGDTQTVKQRLADFVGGENPERDPEYQQALRSIDFVADVVDTGSDLTFIDGELSDSGEHRVYGAAYELDAPQGGEDYLLITMRREDGAWLLANTQLSATNPFADN